MADGNEVKKPGDFGKGHGINKMPIEDDYNKELRQRNWNNDKQGQFPNTLRENLNDD